jgi:hypothetical protein
VPVLVGLAVDSGAGVKDGGQRAAVGQDDFCAVAVQVILEAAFALYCQGSISLVNGCSDIAIAFFMLKRFARYSYLGYTPLIQSLHRGNAKQPFMGAPSLISYAA